MTSPHTAARAVDWAALRRRLDDARAALEREGKGDVEEDRAVLERRAARLARPAVIAARSEERDVITFRLGANHCAIDAALVLNVFRLSGLALLPGAPSPIHGVTMWRGEVLMLLDIRGLLGIATNVLSDLGRVIVVGRNQAAFGFLTDGVEGVRALRPGDVHASPGQSAAPHPLVGGITSDALLVLDGEGLLALANTGA